jgi:hypothetical protein
MSFGLKPSMKQRPLRAVARAIDIFGDERPTGKIVLAGRFHFRSYGLASGCPRPYKLTRRATITARKS